MSQPNFPVISPEITRDKALDMILASIAMEELGLSHIINAEGEKLQYILGTLPGSKGVDADVNQLLEVNKSVSDLLERVMQNQMFLKSKMDKVIDSIEYPNIGPTGPTGPTGAPGGATGPTGPIGPTGPTGQSVPKCFAVFSESSKCIQKGGLMRWRPEKIKGPCICHNSCNDCEIILAPNKFFQIFFTANVYEINSNKLCRDNVSFVIQSCCDGIIKDLFNFKQDILCLKSPSTISLGGISVYACDYDKPLILTFMLKSPSVLAIEQSQLTVIEI